MQQQSQLWFFVIEIILLSISTMINKNLFWKLKLRLTFIKGCWHLFSASFLFVEFIKIKQFEMKLFFSFLFVCLQLVLVLLLLLIVLVVALQLGFLCFKHFKISLFIFTTLCVIVIVMNNFVSLLLVFLLWFHAEVCVCVNIHLCIYKRWDADALSIMKIKNTNTHSISIQR